MLYLFISSFFYASALFGQNANYVKENYTKIDTPIAMRDGLKLYTVIFVPKDNSQRYPILMQRTPYSSYPYGSSNYPSAIMPDTLMKDKYIYVKQDVRGRHMSEGINEEVTPYNPNKKSNKDVDESSDTYDTIEWLLKFLKNDNGRVGLWGISYPGFYATASLPGAHPAIKAVSPQAPVTDEFEGDDAYHRGAFFLMDNFSFENFFDAPRESPREQDPPVNKELDIKDVYDFYLKTGALHNYNDFYFHNQAKIWNEYLEHDTKDEYWQARNIRSHLKNIKPATLEVGGWF